MHLIALLYLFSHIFENGEAVQSVTCGSITKLFNPYYEVRLHSHDIKYGSGSGQQSVTGTKESEDHNSNWRIKGTPNKSCKRGESVKCGDQIRLEHVSTRRLLHSHHFSSPLSSQQEVSCFGDEGEGDTGDVWTVVCDSGIWRRDDRIMFKHVDTDVYLGVSRLTYGRPIHGQHEVIGVQRMDTTAKWVAKEGVFIQPSDPPVRHEEL